MDATNFSTIDELLNRGVADLAALIAEQPDSALAALLAAADLVLSIEPGGRIGDVHIGSGDIASANVGDWPGQYLAETATSDSQDAITALLADTDTAGWHDVNHDIGDAVLPLRWLALPLAGGHRLAIARDRRAAANLEQQLSRAHQVIERDSMRLRQLEARHRLLFETAAEPIFVIDAVTRRVLDANGAARQAAGVAAEALIGQGFANLVHPNDHDAVVAALGALAATDQMAPLRWRLADGTAWDVAATLFRQERGSRLLLRMGRAPSAAHETSTRSFDHLPFEQLPDAFVLTDDRFDIVAGNDAFLDLVGLARHTELAGQPIARFLGRPGVDLGVLLTALRQHGLVRGFATLVRQAHADPGASEGEPVEVSAVSSGAAGATRHGFAVRLSVRSAAADQPALPIKQLAELVGRVPLREIVRESTDLIERLCIEAALTYSGDNRASAAEILGLSRQSLYSKLHRHGLGNLGIGQGLGIGDARDNDDTPDHGQNS